MAKKRPAGEGSVTRRKDGRWMARLTVGRDANGKPDRQYEYAATQAEAVEKLQALRQKRDTHSKGVFGKDTVAGYLHRWLETHVAVNAEEKTYQEYEMAVRLYIVPFIGHLKLARLDGENLQDWQAKLKKAKIGKKKTPVTANMRSRSIKVLRVALNRAVKLRVLPYSPAASLDKPKVTPKEVTPLEPEVCHALFQACQGHRLGDVMIVAAMTGLRKGELFALHWNAVHRTKGS